jgi:hypothetical protein
MSHIPSRPHASAKRTRVQRDSTASTLPVVVRAQFPTVGDQVVRGCQVCERVVLAAGGESVILRDIHLLRTVFDANAYEQEAVAILGQMASRERTGATSAIVIN